MGLRVVGLPGLRVGREALLAHRQEVALEGHPLAAARGRAVRGDEGPGLAVDHDVRDVQDGSVQVQEILRQSTPASAWHFFELQGVKHVQMMLGHMELPLSAQVPSFQLSLLQQRHVLPWLSFCKQYIIVGTRTGNDQWCQGAHLLR